MTPLGCTSHSILVGDMIVRLKVDASWHEIKRGRYGKEYVAERSASYVHAECLEQYTEWKEKKENEKRRLQKS